MEAIFVNKVNNFTSKKGNIGTLIVVEIDGKRNTVWMNDPNYTPLSKTLTVEKQLDEKGKETGYLQLLDNTTVEAIKTMNLKAMKSVFGDMTGLFKL
jgi:hypothetical protein